MPSDHVLMPHSLRTRTLRRAVKWKQFLVALSPNGASAHLVEQCVVAPANEHRCLHVVRGARFYVALLTAAALIPLVAPKVRHTVANAPPFPGWPVLEPGKALPELPLTDTELGFARSFPGKIGKFGALQHSYVVRWVTSPTRRLHPAEDCYRASGFAVHHESRCPAEMSGGEGCFTATRNGATLVVQERITDSNGKTFSDVSAWYWAAVRGVTTGPWWSVTTATTR